MKGEYNMYIYKGYIKFSDGREFEDIWVTKEDALSYYERAPHFNGCIRAELLVLAQLNSEDVTYKVKECLYEYDVNGHYYY
jgi:hypothetical protein